MKKIFAVLISLGFITVACVPKPLAPTDLDSNSVVCTQEAKICPDGSAVGRTGPNCEFEACPKISYKIINSVELENLAGPFTFTAEIPAQWKIQAIPEIEAINVYDPNSPESTTLNQSQIFIRYFSANSFLTLSTVVIHSRNATTTNSRSAVTYEIEKKSDAAEFTHQPTWRNERHFVTDIRQTDDQPSIFYVIAKRPELSQEIFDHFIQSLKFNPKNTTTPVTVPTAPIAEMRSRITKKPYGIYITPKNSPVSPEKFTGYHTGIDVEYGDITTDVPVYAIANGEVLRSGFVSGYGGMLAVRHEINGKSYLAIYGHLDPATLVAIGTQVSPGQQLGILGDGGSKETDGERKHLHFSLYTGNDTNVKGYARAEAELASWVDPLTILP